MFQDMRQRLAGGPWVGLLLLGLLIATFPAERASAQQRSWRIGLAGDFFDGASWFGGDAPDTPSESARFGLFGSYTVTVDPPTPSPVTLDELLVERGFISMIGTPGGSAQLDFQQGIVIDNAELKLGETLFSKPITLTTPGALSLSGGTELLLQRDTRVEATSTTVSGASDNEILIVRDGSAALGDVTLAPDQSGTHQLGATLTISEAAQATVGNLAVSSTGLPGLKGIVQIISGTLTQTSGVTDVGSPMGSATSLEGRINMFGGAHFDADTLHVHPNGRMQTNRGTVNLANSLTIDAGQFVMSNQSELQLSPGSVVAVNGNGELALGDYELKLAATQTLRLAGGILLGDAGVTTSGGQVEILADAVPSRIAAPSSFDGASLNVASGAVAHFEKAFRAEQVLGQGTLHFFDEVHPGEVNPGAGLSTTGSTQLQTSAVWEASATHVVELGGTALGAFDRMEIQGSAQLAGVLEVEVATGSSYQPQAGDQFELLTAQSISGNFDSLSIMHDDPSLVWQLLYSSSSVTLVATIEGDYNADGRVDAADYTLWRDSEGATGVALQADGNRNGIVDAADYVVWHEAYGNVASSSSSIATPEPGGFLLAISAIMSTLVSDRKSARTHQ